MGFNARQSHNKKQYNIINELSSTLFRDLISKCPQHVNSSNPNKNCLFNPSLSLRYHHNWEKGRSEERKTTNKAKMAAKLITYLACTLLVLVTFATKSDALVNGPSATCQSGECHVRQMLMVRAYTEIFFFFYISLNTESCLFVQFSHLIFFLFSSKLESENR